MMIMRYYYRETDVVLDFKVMDNKLKLKLTFKLILRIYAHLITKKSVTLIKKNLVWTFILHYLSRKYMPTCLKCNLFFLYCNFNFKNVMMRQDVFEQWVKSAVLTNPECIKNIAWFKEPVSPLLQMEFKHVFWTESSRKKGPCYPHGYDPHQLYDTFLVPSLCNCSEPYKKQCCIGNPPHTVA